MLEKELKQEVIDIHDSFVAWFTGKSNKTYLNNKLAPRFYKETKFITTKGESLNYDSLMKMLKRGYGMMSPDFKIAISNIEILHEVGIYVLVNYIEWQTNDSNPEISGNYSVRKTTALISKKTPFKWLHIHETIILPKPDDIVAKWKS